MDKKSLTRREFGKVFFGSAAGFVFLETLVASCGGNRVSETTTKTIAPKAATVLRHWSAELQEMSLDLDQAKITQASWQERVELLFSRIEMEELLRFIDFEALSNQLSLPDLGVNTSNVLFPRLEGVPEDTVFVKKIFGMKKGRAIVPHGHSNMASAHLVLKGSFRLRHFEKLADEGNKLRIRESIDKTAKPGDASSISDDRNNVHWFVANEDESFTFDVIVLDLGGKRYDIHNLDMDDSETTSNGELLVPKIDVKTALRKYGKQHHEDGI